MKQRINQYRIESLVPPASLGNEWHTAILLVASVWISVAALFWPTMRSMEEVWSNSRTFAHGFLIAPATAYLIWCYRQQVLSKVPVPSLWGFGAVLLCGLLWSIGQGVGDVLLQQAAVLAAFPSLLWAILGADVAQALRWPLGFFFFMLPVGTSLEPWLQDGTAEFIMVALRLAGITYDYSAHVISLSSGTWEVAPDCGGLRYLLPGLALAYAFATMTDTDAWRRLSFIAICAAALMLANGLRASSIIVAHHLGIVNGADHRLFSYTVFGLTLPLLHWFGHSWMGKKMAGSAIGRASGNHRAYRGTKLIIAAVAALLLMAIAPLCLRMWAGHLPA